MSLQTRELALYGIVIWPCGDLRGGCPRFECHRAPDHDFHMTALGGGAAVTLHLSVHDDKVCIESVTR